MMLEGKGQDIKRKGNGTVKNERLRNKVSRYADGHWFKGLKRG